MICADGFRFQSPPLYGGSMAGMLATKIKAIRQSLGLTQAEFGERLGSTQATVTRWERGSEPRSEVLNRIANLANTSVEQLLGLSESDGPHASQIPVVGYVGAGAVVLPIDDYSNGGGMGHVDRPPFIKGRAVAVEVKGDSLYPVAEDGWRLVYAGEQTIIEDEVLNRLCVVQLLDGRMLVKRLVRGTMPMRYHLLSTNAPMIEDVEVVWAAHVKAIIPS